MAHHFSAENEGGGEFFALVTKNGTKRQKCKPKTRKISAEIRRKKTPIYNSIRKSRRSTQ
ncbi:MAG TPA: hypothetical protein DD650_06560 [Ruminococcaceae bacterium]|nr:hypothetical protein [Oscillospiraceae bacterium]